MGRCSDIRGDYGYDVRVAKGQADSCRVSVDHGLRTRVVQDLRTITLYSRAADCLGQAAWCASDRIRGP